MSLWLCKCDCGKYHTVPRSNLMQGKVRSCGCQKMNLRQRSINGRCLYNRSVDCTERKCETCGWKPRVRAESREYSERAATKYQQAALQRF